MATIPRWNHHASTHHPHPNAIRENRSRHPSHNPAQREPQPPKSMMAALSGAPQVPHALGTKVAEPWPHVRREGGTRKRWRGGVQTSFDRRNPSPGCWGSF
ncbi:hypothetical protein K458DRAFT_112326 [Lentithecium fluviatile CBS 122367]|uniref:Uncharacterized protein n=1 Tax=Lentithecium fluviatile CBS 122367 TaxID=1168545 RepID=A0A6G1INS6_9PLEO|nr:hypothetical protein K458DRAFT_112326 [Lentithecium fluviatile CBS 122367]